MPIPVSSTAQLQSDIRRAPPGSDILTRTSPRSVNLIGVADQIDQDLAKPRRIADRARAARRSATK